jgi:hypothetical protein
MSQMRDKDRIVRICQKIEKLWEQKPDHRFYQMLINNGLLADLSAFWHFEDDKLEEHLDEILKDIERAKRKPDK